MGERKVVQKYYPPDFDPAKLPRVGRRKNQQMKIRDMMPMKVRCNSCGNFITGGTKLNSRKEVVSGKTYLGIKIYRFYYKCNNPKCSSEIIITTDPQNSDYAVESGARRCFEPWRAADEEAGKRKLKREFEEKGNSMKALENRTLDSRREMDKLAALDYLKSMKARHATVSANDMLEKLHSSDVEKKKKLEEEDEELTKLNFPRPKEDFVKRISDEVFEEHGGDFLKRPKVYEDVSSNPTDALVKTSFHRTHRVKAPSKFDVDGYVTGFGNPDWKRTHSAAVSTAPSVLDVLRAGATCVGKTVMDEMAYSINGENVHYGTPTNPCAPDRVPGGSSSGSAVAVGASLVDFSLGTDTGGSVRVPASYCGILGFRPSHDAISTSGVTPMAQSFDTVGWFARDPVLLNQVGRVLLHSPNMDPVRPSQIIIPEDCFSLSSIPNHRTTQVLVKSVEKLFGGQILKQIVLGDYVKEKVPSLQHFMSNGNEEQAYNIPSLAALSSAMRLLQRYEFKKNHAEWVTTVNPTLGPGLHERVWDAVRTPEENIDVCHSVKTELRAALTFLLEDHGVLALPTVPGDPPKLQSNPASLEVFRARAFSLLSVAGVSGFCQVSIPLGMHNNLPVSISLLAKHGSDAFLLNLVETLYDTIKKEAEISEKMSS
ncbi:Amidase [Corchorus capsularis]|uniref:Splicing factor YJU2 n=1 Tax=Corchorus capsularis TaxID=210143 RepID=A0A1R3GWQ2_COCAP|nr:Amidase [Corchorus capsularis]